MGTGVERRKKVEGRQPWPQVAAAARRWGEERRQPGLVPYWNPKTLIRVGLAPITVVQTQSNRYVSFWKSIATEKVTSQLLKHPVQEEHWAIFYFSLNWQESCLLFKEVNNKPKHKHQNLTYSPKLNPIWTQGVGRTLSNIFYLKYHFLEKKKDEYFIFTNIVWYIGPSYLSMFSGGEIATVQMELQEFKLQREYRR
jgi:hypothetical protein